MREAYARRIHLVLGAFVVVALILAGRLYIVQVLHGEEFALLADHQYVRPSQQLFDRGSIYFTDSEGAKVSGASVESGFLVAIKPGEIVNEEMTYERLSAHTPIAREFFMSRVSKKEDPYEEVAHHVSQEAGEKIDALELPGVGVYREQWRIYPGGTLAAHALGLVGYREGETDVVGRYGLERYYDDVLRREEKNLSVNFFAEVFGNIEETLFEKERVRAGNLVTTIDPSVQLFLEDTLAKVKKEWDARQVGGIIMDPSTGEVRGMAMLPNFDPGNTEDVEDVAVFGNPLVEEVREMGSIIKPIGMAIGLDTGAVAPSTTYHDAGAVEVDGYTIRNYDGRGRGTVSMQEVLGQSLNTGMAFVVRTVGAQEFGERLKKFGIGEETGIDLPNESHGLVDNLESPRMVEYVTASFGQGIALTPIETVRALAALGNGGRLVTPHLVRAVEYESGATEEVTYDDTEQAISPATSEAITRMLVEVVDKSLRGGTVKNERYTIAAKTGTAQIARDDARGYYDDRYLHSFFGYFPAYEPKYIVFLYHVEPQGAKYASETLTTPFMDIVEYLINHYQIPPDR